MRPAPDGRWHPLWDTRIARLLGGKLPDLWPLFGALAHVPLLLVHGGRSTLLLAATVARMRAARPDMAGGDGAGVGPCADAGRAGGGGGGGGVSLA